MAAILSASMVLSLQIVPFIMAVKNLLVQRGIADSRIDSVGYGETMPVATNETETGRQRNRRVEIKIAPQQQQ